MTMGRDYEIEITKRNLVLKIWGGGWEVLDIAYK